jgi:uncharacterized protein (DUF362 family)
MVDRREFVKASVAIAAVGGLNACRRDQPGWSPDAVRKPEVSPVAILPAERYDEAALKDTVTRGVEMFGLDVRDRRVVLKPNLVEFDPGGVINTHPTLIAATIEAFRSLGAREVIMAEGPGHRRDNEYLLRASGIHEQLEDMGARFVDLNHDVVRRVALRSSFTRLGELYLPATVLDADLFVSMPKLKTHHWAAVTLSMKNMFGVVPGSLYGWPKNILHWVGLEGSIVDINAALDVPRFNIVDGIVGMEGNGPIQGEAKQVGVVVFGADPVAVDATCTRLMSIDPWRVGYLAAVEPFLGNLATERIEQRGEDLSPHQADFRVLEGFSHTKTTPPMAAG